MRKALPLVSAVEGGREGGGGESRRGRRRQAGWGVLLARGAIHLARF